MAGHPRLLGSAARGESPDLRVLVDPERDDPVPVRPSADAEGKAIHLRSVFSSVARTYDIARQIVSFGQDSRVKRLAVNELVGRSPVRHLDVASGTGALLYAAPRATLRVAVDVSIEMLAVTKSRQSETTMCAVNGDMHWLPFSDQAFDLITIGYGLRYTASIPALLASCHRLLQPGGQIFVFELGKPRSRIVVSLIVGYLSTMSVLLGACLHRRLGAYAHLPVSYRAYIGQDALSDLLLASGFDGVRKMELCGGCFAAHSATKARFS